MEKDQVTFAVQASGLRGPVGRPILFVCEALNYEQQSFLWIRTGPSHASEVHRFYVPPGPLGSKDVEALQTHTVAELYTSLLFWKGIQAELEGLP